MVNRIAKVVAVLKPSGVVMSSLVSVMPGDALDVISHAPEAQLCCGRGHCTQTSEELHTLQVPRKVSPLITQEPRMDNKQIHGKTQDTETGGLAS